MRGATRDPELERLAREFGFDLDSAKPVKIEVLTAVEIKLVRINGIAGTMANGYQIAELVEEIRTLLARP